MPDPATLPRLMLVTDRLRTRGRELVPLVAAAVRGGVGLVQVREPGLTDDLVHDLVARMRDVVPGETILLVNGRPQVALAMGTGLHLPAAHAAPSPRLRRRIRWIGRSAHDIDGAQRAVDEGVAYLVLGTIYRTESKPAQPAAGPQRVREVARRVRPTPIFAIGGVRVSRVPELIRAGAHGVAVCGAILAANDPRRAAEALRLALDVSGHARDDC